MKYIFEIKIKPDHRADEYVEAWKKASELIQDNQGARGTKLFRKINQPDTLLAIADWDSKEARDVAMAKLHKSDMETQKIWQAPKEFGDNIKIGEFEESEWSVLPTK